MRYAAKVISCIIIISFSAAMPGECLRPMSASLRDDSLSVSNGILKNLQEFLEKETFAERFREIIYLLEEDKDFEHVKAVLWLAFVKSSYSKSRRGVLNELTLHYRLGLISACLSLALKRKDSDEVARFLERMINLPDNSILPEAKKLISSFLTVYNIKEPTNIATIIPVYTEQINLQPAPFKENRPGRDYLLSKIEQLRRLYAVNKNITHKLVIVQDGDDSWFYNGKKSIDVAKEIIDEKAGEFPEAVDKKNIVFLELPQETRKRIGSIKGGAIMYGLRWALDKGMDYAITGDADMAFDGSEEGLLLDPAINGDSDLVVGSIFMEDSIVPPRTLFRKIRSRIWLWLEKKILPQLTPLSDTQRSCKCYSRGAMRVLLPVDSEGNFDKHFNYGLSFEGNMLALAAETALFTDEVGVIWVDSPGSSTIRPSYILRMIAGLWKTKRFLKHHIAEYMERGRTYIMYKNLKAQQDEERVMPAMPRPPSAERLATGINAVLPLVNQAA